MIMPLILTLALLNPSSAQIHQEENIKTFFDSAVPGIKNTSKRNGGNKTHPKYYIFVEVDEGKRR